MTTPSSAAGGDPEDQRRVLRQIRNEEIERKRARLADLRRQRQQRQQRRHLSPPTIFNGSLAGGGVEAEAAHLISEVDKMLAGFGFDDVQEATFKEPARTPSQTVTTSAVQTEGLGDFDQAVPSRNDVVVKYDKLIQTDVVDSGEERREEDVVGSEGDERPQEVDDDDGGAVAAAPVDKFIELDNVGDLVGLAQFVSRASRYMERALSIPIDITVDYTRDLIDLERSKGDGIITSENVFTASCERQLNWLDWSNKFPELIVAAYGLPESEAASTTALKGHVAIWSIYLATRPEFQFDSSSEVLCVKFHPSYPTLVIGTTASGQVLIWDQRAGREPVSATRLCSGHVTPIYGFFVTPMHSLITVSDDGRLCTWSDKILKEPTMTKDVDVTPVCVGFSCRDPGTVYLGGENGMLYRLRIQTSEMPKASDLVSFQAHSGPITTITFSGNTEVPKQLANLYLTSSFDFTCRLWSTSQDTPLINIVKDDVVLDVQWCPTNPCHFALCDGNGMVEIWKPGVNPHAALIKYRVSTNPCVKISWAAHGKHLAVGDSQGDLHILNIPGSIYEPNHLDLLQFSQYIHNLCSVVD